MVAFLKDIGTEGRTGKAVIRPQLFLLRMTRAPMTPGTHPKQVRMATIKMDPQPRSDTARGGSSKLIRTRPKLMNSN